MSNTTNTTKALLDNISACWAKLSLVEREHFLSFECAQLPIALCDVRDAKGLEAFHKNLVALANFAESMLEEIEIRERRDNIQRASTILHDEIAKGNITQSVVEQLEALCDEVKQYLEEDPSIEEEEEADEDAYNNIVAVMKAEEAKVDDMLSAWLYGRLNLRENHTTVLTSPRDSFMWAEYCNRFEEGVRKINTLNARQQEAFWAGYFGVTPRFYAPHDEEFDTEFTEYFRN